MATDIGTLRARIDADSTRFDKSADRVVKGTGRMGAGMKTLSVAAGNLAAMFVQRLVTGMVSYTKSLFGSIDATAKFARTLGATIDDVQGLRFAAQISGASVEDLDKSLSRMQRRLGQAATRGGAVATALEALGLSSDELLKQGLTEQFISIAGALESAQTPSEKAALAFEIFGRSAEDLMPLLTAGSDEIAKLIGEVDSLGDTFTDSGARRVEAFNDAMLRMGIVVKSSFRAVVITIAPALQFLSDGFRMMVTSVRSSVGQFMSSTKETMSSVGTWLLDTFLPLVITWKDMFVAQLTFLADAFMTGAKGIISAIGFIFPSMANFQEGFSGLVKNAETGLLIVRFGFENWRDILGLAIDKVLLGVVTLGAEIAHTFTERIPSFLSWMAENWRDILNDMLNANITFAKNVVTNITNLVSGVVSLIKGEGFNFEWTGLLDGFEMTVSSLPDIAEREMGAFEKQLRHQIDDTQKDLGRDLSDFINEGLESSKQKSQQIKDALKDLFTFDSKDGSDPVNFDGMFDGLDDVGDKVDEVERKLGRLGSSAEVDIRRAALGVATQSLVADTQRSADKVEEAEERRTATRRVTSRRSSAASDTAAWSIDSVQTVITHLASIADGVRHGTARVT